MKTTKWEDLKKQALPDKKIKAIEKRARRVSVQMDLRAVRKMAGKTQSQVAAVMRIGQGEVSEAERREDHRISTIRSYIEACGGEFIAIARFGDKTIELHSV